jgi:hypothetical protein
MPGVRVAIQSNVAFLPTGGGDVLTVTTAVRSRGGEAVAASALASMKRHRAFTRRASAACGDPTARARATLGAAVQSDVFAQWLIP